jgi:hypothetical protein
MTRGLSVLLGVLVLTAAPSRASELPPPPAESPRNANYTIEARLDPAQHTLEGQLVLEWRNTSGVALSSFPFHLYWNAFESNLSTAARGEGRRAPHSTSRSQKDRNFGYTHVLSVRLLAPQEAELTPTLRYIHPDDDNATDHTVMEVETPSPLPPGATARFRIEWTSRVPYGDVGRAGWVHDYNFLAQWFPKIGVYWKGGWNCHQFHATTEFFADYGIYDVRLTLPKEYVVGATGVLKDKVVNPNGTQTLRFYQEDVHDFAWTASPLFLDKAARFDEPGYPPVEIRLLLQPDHAFLESRYFEATKIALRSYGAWSAPYPYPHLTVVDPPWGSASRGMEYPTLFTGGASIFSPRALQSPEAVTIHECGHQFWYGLVGNNEFEEAWLDEGINTYHETKASFLAIGPQVFSHRYFGLSRRSGWPVVAPGVFLGRGEDQLEDLRRVGTTDSMVRRGWEYRTPDSYGLNSYFKPSLSLQTLEALVGDDTMIRIFRTYGRRYRFAHPTTEDFIATVNEVTGKDYRPYFDQTWFSSDLCDYAISVRNKRARILEGFTDTPTTPPALAPHVKRKDKSGPYDSEVTVLRLGGVRLPVEIYVEFEDGQTAREAWDGEYRWTRFTYHRPVRVRRAVVDPEGKLAIDVDPSNNSWVHESGQARRAAAKWTARWMLWLQNLLELHTILG